MLLGLRQAPRAAVAAMFAGNGVNRSAVLMAATLAAALTAAAVVAAITTHGAGLSADAATYIAAARQLAAGEGFTVPTAAGPDVPVVLFPPLFPAVLSVAVVAGVDATVAVRWLHVGLVALNILLTARLVRVHAGALPAAAAAWMLVASGGVMRLHAMAWSEPLFLTFTLLGVSALARHLQNTRETALFTAAAAFGAASLVRYVGIALIMAGAVAVSRWAPRPRAVRDVAIFLAVALGPVALWAVRNVAVDGSATMAGAGLERPVAWHPVTLADAGNAATAAAAWIVPLRWPAPLVGAIGAAVILGLGALALTAVRRPLSLGSALPHVPRLMALLVVCYAATVLASMALLDDATPLDGRILAPLHIAGIVLAACLVRDVRLAPAALRWAPVSVAGLVALSVAAGAPAVVRAASGGLALRSEQWRESETMSRLAALDEDGRVYSNHPEAIYLLSGRPAQLLPTTADPISGRRNAQLGAQLAALRRALARSEAAVALFRDFPRGLVPDEAVLRRALSPDRVVVTADGVLFLGPDR